MKFISGLSSKAFISKNIFIWDIGILKRKRTFAVHFLKEKEFVMPKMKTHSSAKKRFKVTGSGKIKRFQARTSHMMRNKSKRAKLALRGSAIVSDGDHKRVKALLCI